MSQGVNLICPESFYCPLDLLEETPNKKPKKEEVEFFDFTPLFFMITDAFIPLNDTDPLSIKETVELLSQNHETLISIQQTPIKKIQDQFDILIKQFEEFEQYRSKICRTLSKLYQISLLNGPTKLQLENVAENLPLLKEKLNDEFKEKINELTVHCRKLIEGAEKCNTAQEIREHLTNIHRMQQQLEEYRHLSQYSDPFENQKTLDLADFLDSRESVKQYPNIISDYPVLTQKLYSFSDEIKSISSIFKELNSIKLQLQQALAKFVAADNKVLPLESRLIQAFGPCFYEAFAQHFWALLKNSKEDAEIQEILSKNEILIDQFDTSSINKIWDNYFSDWEFSDWILNVLKSLTDPQLDGLEKGLQRLSKKKNEINECNDIEQELKANLQKQVDLNMQQLCLNITTPTFATLKELKERLLY